MKKQSVPGAIFVTDQTLSSARCVFLRKYCRIKSLTSSGVAKPRLASHMRLLEQYAVVAKTASSTGSKVLILPAFRERTKNFFFFKELFSIKKIVFP